MQKLLIATASFALLTLGTVGSAVAASFYSITDLGTLKGRTSSIATGINNSGQVVGYLTNDGIYHAFFWENGVMTDLGTLAGSRSWTYGGLNSLGVVVGRADTDVVDYNGNSIFHAFLWSKNLGMVDLTASDRFFRTRAEDINDAGQVIITTENHRGVLLTPETQPIPEPTSA